MCEQTITAETLSDYEAAMIVEGQWDLAGHEESEETFLAAAQRLINTGLAWSLQGFFGRTCASLIEQGHCVTAEDYRAGLVDAG